MGVYEVTKAQFAKFVEAEDYKTDAEKDGKGGWGWSEKDGKIRAKARIHLAELRLRTSRRPPGGERELE
jgi:formylglycine-generating enzyme required for sulfatase activity